MFIARLGLVSSVVALLAFTTPSSAQTGGDRALGEYLSAECVACHQISGKSAGAIPPIVGLSETHIREALTDYRTKKRSHDVMNALAARLNQDEINALAAYFASAKP